MPEKIPDTTVIHQVELAIRQLDCLATLPCVAARIFSHLFQPQSSLPALAETIESDPALTAKIFSLISQQGISLPGEEFSIRRALDKMPAHIVRDAVLSVKVSADFENDNERTLPKKQLALHALAVACCAKNIAETTSPRMDSQLAYSAGLLHDIGKLALEEAMPKSFDRIVEEAKSQNASACTTEQKYLGLDHTILGKRLAQKWSLPDRIALAIWLHHSNTSIISQSMPQARIAQVVQLADSIVRQCGIGQSGSYDSPQSLESIAQSLAIGPGLLQQIQQGLAEQVTQKSKALGLDLPNAAAAYYDIVHTTAVRLAQDNTKLSLENRQLQTTSGNLKFITEFLSGINSTTPVMEVAENFATRWQKFYQTGLVCVYLVPPYGSQVLEVVVVEPLAQSKTVYLKAPVDSATIPHSLASSFDILDAHGHIDWLFEQIDVDFDFNQTKIMPLLSSGKAIGAIVFELRYPGDIELFSEQFETATSIAGSVLAMALAWGQQQRFAEQFAPLVSQSETGRQQPESAEPLEALAEMAAGAAHELNNPLSVISGRAQLLAEAETDPEKKRMLKQINKNTAEIAQIVDDLMSFAKPPRPRPTRTNTKTLLDEAKQLATQKTGNEQLDIRVDISEAGKNVFIDSAQIASAIASIFANSLESYTNGLGRIEATADLNESGDFVRLQISDRGCGMNPQTIRKATQPFFSDKPAGRKRGMGLAHAQRVIQANGGSLAITSQPANGTIVTILLPKA